MKKNLYKYLAGNDYPGRGIVLGKSPDGQKRSSPTGSWAAAPNSRNRVFEPIDGRHPHGGPLTRPSSRTRTSSSTTLC